MKTTLSPRAEKQLKKLSKVNQIIIINKIRSISKHTEISGEKKLKKYRSIYRIRIGDHRIVYKKTKREVYIVLIGHRKDIYKIVKRLLA